VIGLLNLGEPAIAWKLGHWFEFLMIFSLVIGFWLYIAYKSKARSLPKTNKYGPLFFATLAVFLIPIIPAWKLSADLGLTDIASVWEPHCD